MLTFDAILEAFGELITARFHIPCYTDVVPQNAVRPSAFLWTKSWTMAEASLETMEVVPIVAIDLMLPYAADEFAAANVMAQAGAQVGATFCGQCIAVGDDYTVHVDGVTMGEPLASVVPLAVTCRFLDDLADEQTTEVFDLLTKFQTNNEELNLL